MMKIGLDNYFTILMSMSSVSMVLYYFFHDNIILFFLCNNIFSLHFGMNGSISIIWPRDIYGPEVGNMLVGVTVNTVTIFMAIMTWGFDF